MDFSCITPKTDSVLVLAIHGYSVLVLLERNKKCRNSDSLQSYIMKVTKSCDDYHREAFRKVQKGN